jgi:hypothetical protein
MLEHVNNHYNQGLNLFGDRPALPFVITENGISDEDDIFRPSYLIEHLLAVRRALDAGIPVQGYIFWTISDNFEWTDGYGPKFGLVAVDRANGLVRRPRPSYYLFSDIAKEHRITQAQRDTAWTSLSAQAGHPRKFYRAEDGKTALDTPRWRPVAAIDWRLPDAPIDLTKTAVAFLEGLAQFTGPL